LLALLLTGCGFHLQGDMTALPQMERTYIAAVERNTQFHRELRRQFQESGVNLVDSPEEATAIFSIISDQTGQRVLSVSARNVPTEYEVF
jgi:LPS-assembly lipoprotein